MAARIDDPADEEDDEDSFEGPTEPVVEGERVRLRPPRPNDLDALVEAAGSAEVAAYTGLPHPYTREHGAEVLTLAMDRMARGQAYHFAVADIGSDRLLGMVALSNLDHESEHAEIMIWVGREHWGEGRATEAFVLAIEVAFETLGLTRLWAFVLEGNAASVRLMERLGFREEGRLRWHTRRDGAWMDKVWFGLLREEWEARTGRAR